MEKHIRILGVIYIAFGALGILAALLLFIGFTGKGLASENKEILLISASAATAVSILLIVISVLAIIGGEGLLRRRSWARLLVIILGCLYLLSFPLGTAIGIYTLWALTKHDSRILLTQG